MKRPFKATGIIFESEVDKSLGMSENLPNKHLCWKSRRICKGSLVSCCASELVDATTWRGFSKFHYPVDWSPFSFISISHPNEHLSTALLKWPPNPSNMTPCDFFVGLYQGLYLTIILRSGGAARLDQKWICCSYKRHVYLPYHEMEHIWIFVRQFCYNKKTVIYYLTSGIIKYYNST